MHFGISRYILSIPKLRYMAEQMEAWGNKGIFMHTSGRVPAAYADQPAKHIIARYSIYIIYI